MDTKDALILAQQKRIAELEDLLGCDSRVRFRHGPRGAWDVYYTTPAELDRLTRALEYHVHNDDRYESFNVHLRHLPLDTYEEWRFHGDYSIEKWNPRSDTKFSWESINTRNDALFVLISFVGIYGYWGFPALKLSKEEDEMLIEKMNRIAKLKPGANNTHYHVVNSTMDITYY